MTGDIQPADRQLVADLLGKIPWELSYAELRQWAEHNSNEWSTIIARHRAEHEGNLRAEIERLRRSLSGVVTGLAPLIEHLKRNASIDWSQLTRQEGNMSLAAYSEAKKALEKITENQT